jgi:hypothetical protein
MLLFRRARLGRPRTKRYRRTMRTRGNLITERAGVNFVRRVVERSGCLVKEINLQHDFGQDATMVLVVDGQVRHAKSHFKSSPERLMLPGARDGRSYLFLGRT